MSTGSSYADTSAASRLVITPGAQRNYKTWVSEPVIASFDDADLPNPVEHIITVLGVYLLFIVTAFAFVGAAFLLFFCRF